MTASPSSTSGEPFFAARFKALTGFAPFPWQQRLYDRFVSDRPDNIPEACDLPTGLGKTSVVAVWLIAKLTCPERIPTRLVYVVNRRTVVDQTTTEVEKYRERLKTDECKRQFFGFEDELAISTLRGQFADNRQWCEDPSRPAVIVGTVDMIGSRLLFSGFGLGFKSSPLHAGLTDKAEGLPEAESTDPAFLCELAERESHMHALIGRLPADLRYVVYHRYWAGEHVNTIATALGIARPPFVGVSIALMSSSMSAQETRPQLSDPERSFFPGEPNVKLPLLRHSEAGHQRQRSRIPADASSRSCQPKDLSANLRGRQVCGGIAPHRRARLAMRVG